MYLNVIVANMRTAHLPFKPEPFLLNHYCRFASRGKDVCAFKLTKKNY